jgi:hypothetical protein
MLSQRPIERIPKLIFPLGAISRLLLVVTIMGPLTYVAGAANWPLQDHALLAIDRAMAMDPELIARYVNDHEWLAGLLLSGYGLIKWPRLGIRIVLALTSRLVRLQLFRFRVQPGAHHDGRDFDLHSGNRNLLRPQHRTLAISVAE